MTDSLVSWLLDQEEDIPAVRYRALTELLDLPESDPEVKKAKADIPGSADVVRIFKAMHPDGYWLPGGVRQVSQGGEPLT